MRYGVRMRACVRSLIFLALAALLMAAAPAERTAAKAPKRQVVAPALGARLVVPDGVLTRSTTAPISLPHSGVSAEDLYLTQGGDLLVTVNMWPDPLRLGAAGAMTRALAWLLDRDSRLEVRTAGRRAVPAFLLVQPRSPQSYGRRIALLGSGGVVARITCENTSDVRAVAAFELAMSTFDGPP